MIRLRDSHTLLEDEISLHQRKRRSKKKKNKVKRQKTESDTDDSDEWEEIWWFKQKSKESKEHVIKINLYFLLLEDILSLQLNIYDKDEDLKLLLSIRCNNDHHH